MQSEVHLTRAQKWDLVRMAAAAIVSTVFFCIPLFLARPNGARAAADPDIIAAGVPESPPANIPVQREPATATDAVTVLTTMEVVKVTVPVLQDVPRLASVPPTRTPQRANTATPLGRRLARFFAGTGKYGVRPFPTVGNSGGD